MEPPYRRLGSVTHAQLAEQAFDMNLNGGLGDAEVTGNLFVRCALDETTKNLCLTFGKSYALLLHTEALIDFHWVQGGGRRLNANLPVGKSGTLRRGKDTLVKQNVVQCALQDFARDVARQNRMHAGLGCSAKQFGTRRIRKEDKLGSGGAIRSIARYLFRKIVPLLETVDDQDGNLTRVRRLSDVTPVVSSSWS